MTDQIIFGRALIDAYRLESSASPVPRVILAREVKAQLNGFLSRHLESQDSVCRDIDGWWFVNYLQATLKDQRIDREMIRRHKESVILALDVTPRHEVLPVKVIGSFTRMAYQPAGTSTVTLNRNCHWAAGP